MTTLKQTCERILELDGKATKGPWFDPWLIHNAKMEVTPAEDVGIKSGDETVCGVGWYDGPHFLCKREDSALITDFRDSAPKIARALLIAMEALEIFAAEDVHQYTLANGRVAARRVLNQIAALEASEQRGGK